MAGKRNPLFLEGTIHKTNMGNITVVNYVTGKNVLVKFSNTGSLKVTTVQAIQQGKVKDDYLPSVYGVGYFGQGKHTAKIKGKTSTIYNRWVRMLSRCYNTKDKDYMYYGAKGVRVHSGFECFQIYATWFTTMCDSLKEDPYTTKMQVDKDTNANGYCPKGCILTTVGVNNTLARDKEFTLIAPNGKVHITNNLTATCKALGIKLTRIHDLTRGKTRKTRCGWTLGHTGV